MRAPVITLPSRITPAVQVGPASGFKAVLADASGRRWKGVLTVEGMQTGDGRVIAEGAIEWADLPLPLNWLKDGNNHAPGTGAPQVGIIESIVREGNEIVGEGVFDEGSPDALEVIRQMQEGVAPGGTRFFVSIDPDDWEVELVAPEGVDDLDEIMLIGSGFTPKLRAWWGRVQRWMIRAAAGEDDPEDAEVVMESAADELIERATRMRIRGACYDNQTEILTETKGWLSFVDLPKDERVATLNPKTQTFEWQEPTDYTVEEWDGPMVRFEGGKTQSPDSQRDGKTLDLLVTPNHRMIVRESAKGRLRVMPASELAQRSNRSYRFPQTSGWDEHDVKTFRIDPAPLRQGFCSCGCSEPLQTSERGRCSVEGCEQSAYTKAMCNRHYQRWLRHGDPAAGGPMRVERRNRRIDKDDPRLLPGHKPRIGEPLILNGDDYAAFMGAWLAEGWVALRGRGLITISQSPSSRGFVMYGELLDRMFPGRWRHDGTNFVVNDERLARHLRPLRMAVKKLMPPELKNFSTRQLRLFWDYYMAGDGDATGRRAYTSSPRLAGDLQEVAQKLGMWAVVKERPYRESEIDGRRIRPTVPQLEVVIHNQAGLARGRKSVWDWRTETVERHVGTVYCVTVPNEILYVRRNGVPAWCGNTLCTISAFDGAWIELTDEGAPVEKLPEPVEEVLASAYPTKPPTAWFRDPALQELQRFVTVEDGRIYGHLAGWNECHLSYPEICLDPPASEHDYAYFHIGRVKTEEGELVETGPIALKGGHAGLGLDYRAAQAHYDDPATGIADVRVGPDEHGIWFSGALRPDATEEDIRCLRASGVSGDWRRVGAGPELIGICSVNVPGYPKVMARVASGELLALVAAGGRPEADDGSVFGKIQERFGPVEKVLLPMALGELDKRVLKAIDRRVSQ